MFEKIGQKVQILCIVGTKKGIVGSSMLNKY